MPLGFEGRRCAWFACGTLNARAVSTSIGDSERKQEKARAAQEEGWGLETGFLNGVAG